jgi:hypothetical protein
MAAILDQCSYRQAAIKEKADETVSELEVKSDEVPQLVQEEPEETPTVEDQISEETMTAISEHEIEYFFETALGAEYGSSLPVIHKWSDNIRIQINGTPTSEDLDTLNQVINELNSLINTITLDIVTRNPNIDIYFDTVDRFPSIEQNYVSGNMGFFWAWWNNAGAFYKGKILIASDGISQRERSHLIREELTQILGIMNDSNKYEDSIFYIEWTDTTEYLPIDKVVISLLYDPRLKLGMTQSQVKDVLGIPQVD